MPGIVKRKDGGKQEARRRDHKECMAASAQALAYFSTISLFRPLNIVRISWRSRSGTLNLSSVAVRCLTVICQSDSLMPKPAEKIVGHCGDSFITAAPLVELGRGIRRMAHLGQSGDKNARHDADPHCRGHGQSPLAPHIVVLLSTTIHNG